MKVNELFTEIVS